MESKTIVDPDDEAEDDDSSVPSPISKFFARIISPSSPTPTSKSPSFSSSFVSFALFSSLSSWSSSSSSPRSPVFKNCFTMVSVSFLSMISFSATPFKTSLMSSSSELFISSDNEYSSGSSLFSSPSSSSSSATARHRWRFGVLRRRLLSPPDDEIPIRRRGVV